MKADKRRATFGWELRFGYRSPDNRRKVITRAVSEIVYANRNLIKVPRKTPRRRRRGLIMKAMIDRL